LAQSEEKVLDYLEPFLEQLNVDDVKNVKLTRQQAVKLRDDCLADLKQRLVDKANLIQARFDKVIACSLVPLVFLIRLRRMHEMQTIVSDVHGVCLSSLSRGLTRRHVQCVVLSLQPLPNYFGLVA